MKSLSTVSTKQTGFNFILVLPTFHTLIKNRLSQVFYKNAAPKNLAKVLKESVLEFLISTSNSQENTSVLISNPQILHKASCIFKEHNVVQDLIRRESFLVICCHSLHHYCLSSSFVFICCHSLPLVIPLVLTRCHCLSIDVSLVCLFMNNGI